jgi:hypothetical protein
VPSVTVVGILASCLLAGVLTSAWGEGIYTCVDAKGRRLTSDRPIIECLDREQRELTPGGSVKRKIGPSLTADERAAEEEKKRLAAEEHNRQLDEKKRERALLTRYPDRAAHDKERAAAMAQADAVITAASRHVDDLVKDRKRLDLELEFFKSDPSRVPPQLKRQIDENADSIEAQKRFVLAQEQEKRRINLRFDEELVKLQSLWALRAVPLAPSPRSSAPTTANAASGSPTKQ